MSITASTLTQYSAQEVFDFIVTSVVKQGKPAIIGDGNSPTYRTPDGLKCPGGFLLPDDHPAVLAALEGDDMGIWPALAQAMLVPTDHSALISSLQQCHDAAAVDWRADFIPSFLRRACDIAKRWCLTMPSCVPPCAE